MNTLALIVDDFVLLCFAGLMAWAAVSDIRSYKIPNRVTLGILAVYPSYVLASNTSVDWIGAVVVGLAVLGIGFVLFAMKWTGAGDVKLLTAASVWAGPELVAPFLVVTCLAGGALSLAVMLRARFTRPAATDGAAPDPVPLSGLLKVHVPYGAAIAAGGLYIVLRRMAS